MEMVRAQNRAIELEGALAEEKAKGMKLAEDVMQRQGHLEVRGEGFRSEKSQSLTQGRIIAAFKESDDFLEAVRDRPPPISVMALTSARGSSPNNSGPRRRPGGRRDGSRTPRQRGGRSREKGGRREAAEAKSYIDERPQLPPHQYQKFSRMDTSSLTKESNVMSQADLDNLGTTYSFPQGYDSGFLGWRDDFVSRQGEGHFDSLSDLPCAAVPNAWRSVHMFAGDLAIFKTSPILWRIRCLYSLSPLPDSGWYYFKARPEKKLAPRIPEQRKGVENEVLFCLGGRVGVSPGVAASESLLRVSQILGNTRDISRAAARRFRPVAETTRLGDEGEFGTARIQLNNLGVIRRGVGGAIRRALPGIPDETLLRWLGGKVKDPFRISYLGRPAPVRTQGRIPSRIPSCPPSSDLMAKPWPKRQRRGGGQAPHQRGKETGRPRRLKGSIQPRSDQCSGACCRGGDLFPAGDGGSQSMSDASVARRLLTGVIPESDKKEVDQLSENDLVAKSFHALGQAETRVAELNEEKSRPGTEVDDLKTTVAELTSKLAKAKELAIEDFKASEEFKAAVTDSAATYFGDGFEFCKRQLLHQFPHLGADVANMAMDPSFAEEEEATKEGGEHV
ncbi:hypothetical protein Acr_14g0001800 [Actinidia rufa]|uniref:Uncharacterized protein n=1 Tax=Actinidia rufa TaxID=165716 RepID=A0A7J0FPB6_9ERIC|nr:hypothetical protein Acr_14g0001800 [Actinidia rufa]